MIEQDYPSLLERVKAAITDTVVLIFISVGVSFVFGLFENVPEMLRLFALIFVFGFYDPLCISLLGATVGHMLVGIEVKQADNHSKNIILPMAIFRFLFKVLLGGISLLTVTSSNEKNAIHDMVSGSIVLYARK